MPTLDSFDANAHSSPLLNSTDPTFNGGLGLEQFTLNETSPQNPVQNYHSPGHSPHISPRLMPQQQALPQFTANDNFGMGMNTDVNPQFGNQSNGLEMFPGAGQEPFPSLNFQGADPGNADAMSPPTISVNYAPPTMPTDHPRPSQDGEALSPPIRCE
jgi:transcription factor CRZ1